MGEMKAYYAMDKQNDEGSCTVVFAESRGKAKAIAITTDTCEDAEYINIQCRRLPELDKYYKGRTEMDWNNDKDRIILVKHGWHCLYECYDGDLCPAKEWCEQYGRG